MSLWDVMALVNQIVSEDVVVDVNQVAVLTVKKTAKDKLLRLEMTKIAGTVKTFALDVKDTAKVHAKEVAPVTHP